KVVDILECRIMQTIGEGVIGEKAQAPVVPLFGFKDEAVIGRGERPSPITQARKLRERAVIGAWSPARRRNALDILNPYLFRVDGAVDMAPQSGDPTDLEEHSIRHLMLNGQVVLDGVRVLELPVDEEGIQEGSLADRHCAKTRVQQGWGEGRRRRHTCGHTIWSGKAVVGLYEIPNGRHVGPYVARRPAEAPL